MVRVSGPPAAHVVKEAISSVLISGIASCNVGSGLSAGGVTTFGLRLGIGTILGSKAGVDVDVGSGWTPVAWRRAQLLQQLLHFGAVVHHAPHHLGSCRCIWLLRTLVI